MNKRVRFLVACLIFSASAHAQFLCGFDAFHAQTMATNPAYTSKVNQFNADWAQRMAANPPNGLVVNGPQGTIYEIPVVVHVIHTGGAIGSTYNPTDASIIGMINYLNSVYAATWPGFPNASNGGTNFPVRFALAQRDPDCNTTSGIVRLNGSSLAGYAQNGVALQTSNGVNDADLKALSRWDNNDYYNVWIVNKIDGVDGTVAGVPFVAGYAAFAGSPADVDGTVMLATQAVAGSIVLPHEIGHAFNLYHTFQGGNTTTCPPNNNCNTDGDMICDTEPERQSNFNCPADPNPCTNASYQFVQHNIMDYSSCQDRFTPGQRTRWMAGLQTGRASLVSAIASLPSASSAVTAACVPPSIAQPANTANAGVFNVVLNDMHATSLGGYSGDGNKFYVDRSCRQRANVIAGQSYALSVKTGPNPERVRVYIDYNNDGVFGTAAPELVYSHDGTLPNETHTTNITIPTTGAVTCLPLRMRVVSDRTIAAAPTACGALTYGQAEDYSVSIQGPSNAATISIALTNGTNPSCFNSPLTFTATLNGTATTPTYQWYVNRAAVPGATGTTYTSATLTNGDTVTARVFYPGRCGPDTSLSNAIVIQRSTTITPDVSIALTAGQNPGCATQTLTFTATPTSGGTAPVYTWQVYDGVTYKTVAGVTGNTYTTDSLKCNYGVRAILTSNLSCASPVKDTSNMISLTCTTLTATATITQTAGNNPACIGRPVTFTGTGTNPGNAPSYSWRINGVAAGTGTTFTTSTLNNQDTVQMIYTPNNPCVAQSSVPSNKIVVTVLSTVDTPTVAVAITKGANPGCGDTLLEFTAATAHAGNASYTWYLNGNNVATGAVYSSTTFVDGDRVVVRAVAGPGCHYKDTIYSDTIRIVRLLTLPSPVISFIGSLLVSDRSPVQWYGPNSNIPIPGATAQSYRPTAAGTYYARSVSGSCLSGPSNVLQVSLLTIGSYNMQEVKIFPNPTNGLLHFDWGNKLVNVRIAIYSPSGQVLVRTTGDRITQKTMDLSMLAAGTYFVVLQDEQGNTGTVSITLAK